MKLAGIKFTCLIFAKLLLTFAVSNILYVTDALANQFASELLLIILSISLKDTLKALLFIVDVLINVSYRALTFNI